MSTPFSQKSERLLDLQNSPVGEAADEAFVQVATVFCFCFDLNKYFNLFE